MHWVLMHPQTDQVLQAPLCCVAGFWPEPPQGWGAVRVWGAGVLVLCSPCRLCASP